MEAYLRLMGGLCIGRKRSALSYRLPFKFQSIFIKELSVVSDQQSELNRFTRSIGKLISKRKPSAVSSQLSDMARHILAISRLKLKIHQLSAISSRLSDKDRYVPAISKLIPKAYHLIPFLILVFVSCGAVLAQEPVGHTAPAAKAETVKNANKHQYVTDESIINRTISLSPDADLTRYPMIKYNPDYAGIDGLKIGDKIPDELWDMPLWVVNHPEGKDTIRLREYEDEKLLVLDFWASWCSPCVESMNKWNDVAIQKSNEVKVIGVHLDFDYKALPFSQKKQWSIPSVIGNEAYLINRYFFNRDVVSRMTWIKDGKLLAITSVKGYDFDTVQKVLNNEPVTIPIDSNWTYFNTLNQ